jgi:hypothetical protein
MREPTSGPGINTSKIISTLHFTTFPDGRRSTFTKAGETYYSMAPEYTYDDGHLNETGRKRIAEQLLVLLANLN